MAEMYAVSGRSNTKRHALVCALLFLFSYAVLIPGLTAPLFTVEANITMFGFQVNVLNLTKSTLGTVQHLWSGGYTSPALLILFFSVFLPFLKLAAVLYAAWAFHRGSGHAQPMRCVRTISKWATVDAFCILTFTAFLSGDSRISVTLHSGFYCFFAYCLLSIAAALAFPTAVDDMDRLMQPKLNLGPWFTFIAWGTCLFLPVISLKVTQLGIDKSLSFLGMVEALSSAGLKHVSFAALTLVGLLPLLEVLCGLAQSAQLTTFRQMKMTFVQHWAMLDVFAASMLVTALAAKGMAGEIAVEVSGLGWGVLTLCVGSHMSRLAINLHGVCASSKNHASAAKTETAQDYGSLEAP